MKNYIFFLCAVFLSSIGFSQGTETFTNITTAASDGNGITSSYQGWTWVGENGETWSATDARTDQNINNEAITVRNGFLSTTIVGGIGDLTLTTQRKFGGSTGQITVSVNGTMVGTIPYNSTVQTSTITGIDVTGNVTLLLETPGNGDRVAMDDLTWTEWSVAPADDVVNLNSAADFGILAATGITSVGFSVISNTNIGVTPGVRASITGFPPAVIINGAIYASDDGGAVPAMLNQAQADLVNAYNFAAGASAPAPATVAGDLGGLTLAPGIYKSTSSLMIQGGDLTLDAQGDPDATWIFQIASSLTTNGGAGGNVILTGGAQAKNITWQVGSSATIGNNTAFSGNILAYTSITMNTGSSIMGRLLAINGLVALSGTNIIDNPNFETCEEGDGFVTTWKTTTSNESITIPTYAGETYDYSINWGDGSSTTNVPGNISHTYAIAGTYTVSICGTFPRIYFNNGGDRLKIQSIDQWGTNVWSSMNGAFAGATYLVSNATDMPDLSMVNDMYGMFAFARSFNGDANFGNWDVSNVANMNGMFGGASVFNHPIGGWNVSNVTSMEQMFHGATIFNQDLSAWNVGNVTNMKYMFATAMRFNQDISNWNVSNVTNMYFMFFHANRFDQDLGGWDVSNVINMTNMFKNVKLSTANYDALLNGWSTLPLMMGVKLNAGTSNFCSGEVARQNMISNFNWTIQDGGKNCSNPFTGDRLAVGDNSAFSGVTLYPNPMGEQMNLFNPEGQKLESVSIYDLSGRLIKTVDLREVSSEMTMDVSNLSTATYMIVINGEAGSISKLMIKK